MNFPASATQQIPVLEALDGRYDLVRPLGGGRLGEVYEAKARRTGQRVAVRVIERKLVGEPKQFATRFFAEGARRLLLRHQHTLHLLDYGRTLQDHFFLAMDYVAGVPLARVLSARGPLAPTLAAQICDRVCASLEEAHAHGVTHAHVSPHLIWLTGRGFEGIKVVGFGDPLLRGMAQLLPWQPRHVRYAAPERLSGERVSFAADIYGVGLLLYELIAGKPAFDHDSAVRVLLCQRQGSPLTITSARGAWSCAPALAEIVAQCLEPSPAMRFQSMAALRSALMQRVIRVAA